MNSTSVVLTLTSQNSIGTRRIQVAVVGVTVAHAATSNGDVLDRVEVATRHRGILSSHGHEMSQQILRADQTDSDVRGPRPLLQHGRVEVVVGGGSIVQQHDGDLSVLQRHNLRVLVGADHVVVSGDRAHAALEDRLAIGDRVTEVLPRCPGLAVIHGLLQGECTGTR